MTTGTCTYCKTERPLSELIRVTPVRDGTPYLVCVPRWMNQHGVSCFRAWVGTVHVHRIEAAVPRGEVAP